MCEAYDAIMDGGTDSPSGASVPAVDPSRFSPSSAVPTAAPSPEPAPATPPRCDCAADCTSPPLSHLPNCPAAPVPEAGAGATTGLDALLAHGAAMEATARPIRPASDPAPLAERGEEREGSREVRTYPEAARTIALWLKEFCDESKPFPAMIADASRRAARALSEYEAYLIESEASRRAAAADTEALSTEAHIMALRCAIADVNALRSDGYAACSARDVALLEEITASLAARASRPDPEVAR